MLIKKFKFDERTENPKIPFIYLKIAIRIRLSL